ncbi:hypothetical protein, partial [Merismopedia glauca]
MSKQIDKQSHHSSQKLKWRNSLLASLAIAGCIHLANSLPAKATTEVKPIAVSQITKSENSVIQSITVQKADFGGIMAIIVIGGFIIFVPLFFGGLVVIGEKEVGIVVKKFALSGKGLPAGRLIAMKKEAGYQADTLPPG